MSAGGGFSVGRSRLCLRRQVRKRRLCCGDDPFVVELSLGEIGCHHTDGQLVANPELAAAAPAYQRIIGLVMSEVVVFEQAVYADEAFAFMFDSLDPESEGSDAADDAFELFT